MISRLRRHLADAWRFFNKTIVARATTPLHLVACRALHGGSVVYVADVDGRRLVFVAGQHMACLLAQYESPRSMAESQGPEGTPLAARLKAHMEC
jgi:hypothetical protein